MLKVTKSVDDRLLETTIPQSVFRKSHINFSTKPCWNDM